ncbi:hypothetical protein ACMF3Y_001555 [Campylobacter coli]
MADLEQVVNDLNLASQSLQELREKYDGALDLLDNKNTEITGALDSAKSDALQEIQTISDTATSQISQLKDISLNAINEAKNTATSEISSKKEEALGEFSQATSEFNSAKEEVLSQIEQAKAEQGEKITALEQAKENIITELSKKTKLLIQDLEWTVGVGGKFGDLQSALNEACKYQNSGKYSITIEFLGDITQTETLKFSSANLGFVIIDGKNFNLQIEDKNLFEFYTCIIPSFKNITLKNIGSNLTENISGIYSSGSISSFNSSKTMSINNFYIGIHSADSSNFSCLETVVENCFRAFLAQSLGNLDIRGSDIKNCTNGLYVTQSGIIQSQFCTFSNVTTETNVSYNTLTNSGIIYN